MGINYYALENDNASTFRSTVKLLNVASAKYSGDWQCQIHTHTYMELFYIIGGTGLFLIDSQEYPVKTNDIIVINSDVPHGETSIHAQALEYIVLGIEGIELAAGKRDTDRFCILDHYESTEISGCLWNILREMEQKKTGFEEVCQACMEMLVIRLMRSIDLSVSAQSQLTAGNRQCAMIKRYIDLHFKEALSLEALAEKMHMNKYHLSHVFKEEYGVSPISYMFTRRIAESKYLLTETDLTLSQISQRLGFSSPSYFSQAFRRTEGIAPADYRRNARGL